MSNLLSQASLVMIPSGYKEDVVYSQIPSDGSGDLSFTRASNGTRINSAGLVEVCPWNLALYSEDFSNGVWTTTSTTITADNTTAPNGTATADKVEISSSSNARVQQIINSNLITGGLPCTFSVYLKSVSGTGNVGIRSGQTGLSSVFSYTNQWQRFEWTFNAYALSEIMQFCNNTLVGGADSAPTFYAWGAQLNIGSTAKPYFPTTDRLNVPRLTYQNGGGGCPSLLLEKQSTNLLLNSEQFNQWSTNGTTTSNVAISPDGTQNADRLNYTSGSVYWLDAGVNVTNGTAYTFTLYVKPTSVGDQFRFYIDGGFNVSQTITTDSSDWKRYEWTFTATATASINPHILLGYGMTSQSILVWGAQVEASSYATSYIPTTSSSATRVADACFKTGISSLIGQTEGTLYFELQRDNTDNDTRLQISDGSGLNWLFVSIETGLNPRAYCNVGGVNQFSVYGSPVSNSTHKVALAYKSNDFKVYIDGVAVITQTSGSVPACNRIDVGSASPSGPVVSTSVIKEVVLFPTRLTNAELASLTTI